MRVYPYISNVALKCVRFYVRTESTETATFSIQFVTDVLHRSEASRAV